MVLEFIFLVMSVLSTIENKFSTYLPYLQLFFKIISDYIIDYWLYN